MYLIFAIFFGVHTVYEKQLTPGLVFINIAYIIAFVICTTTFAILFIYIMELQERLAFSNHEHIKLLNGMHEGLTILSEKKVTTRGE